MSQNQATYTAPSKNQSLDIVNVYDLEQQASQIIPKGGFDYIAGGAGDEYTLDQNITSFNQKRILPRVLADVENPDTRTTLFGSELPSPIIMAPIAAHGLAHESREVGTAKGVSDYGTILSISTYTGSELSETSKVMGDTPKWFQLYMSKDNEVNKAIIDDAKADGATAIVLTADATVMGNREKDKLNQFVFPFDMPIVSRYLRGFIEDRALNNIYLESKQKINTDDVRFIAEYSDMPVIVKGIQAPEDAIKAIDAGAAGIWVSNHGGRQLDGAPGSFETLALISEAVSKRVPIIFDSGIRRGEHIFKALAMGADCVAIGRPVLYGLALGGAKGVTSVFEYFENDLKRVMQLAGTQTVEDIKKTALV
ncbi:lactate oxidase [Alkalibacterium olivapovliticus]|uniref:L-lactate oxidase n=1 Tax=Alkalibacterium olivapovliticus TaxID=99907 RepID=A0A2T0W6Z6_9LACT|nr:lactate oxidase [Alkalibacterium olivapovliticus]PRY82475.1 lactate oxidase [Alkalibacterium olivapovliticus]